jgi:hypothetical protein
MAEAHLPLSTVPTTRRRKTTGGINDLYIYKWIGFCYTCNDKYYERVERLGSEKNLLQTEARNPC